MPNPLNLLCIISLAGALIMGVRLYFSESENTRLNAELAIAAQVNTENLRQINSLQTRMKEFDRATLEAAEDKAKTAALRAQAAKTLQRTRDENADFKTWYDSPAYPGLERMLRQALGQGGDNNARTPASPAAGLPANPATGGNPD